MLGMRRVVVFFLMRQDDTNDAQDETVILI